MSRYEDEFESSQSSQEEEQYERKAAKKRKGCAQCGSQAHWYCKPKQAPRAARRPVERETQYATNLQEPPHMQPEEESGEDEEQAADYYQSTKKPRGRARSESPRRAPPKPQKAKPTRCGRCGRVGHNARTCAS